MDLAGEAAAARRVLVREYWDDDLALFRPRPGPRWLVRREMAAGAWHYWWQAHALQVLLDGVEAGEPQASALVPRLLEGVERRSGGRLTANRYYDDLAWMGLAALRAYRLGLVDPAVPVALAEAVLAGHDPVDGGFRWRQGGDYLNVAASAPAAMLLAGTARLAGRPGFADLARATAAWLHERLVDPTGLVLDGGRVVDGLLELRRDVWSYTVGAVAGLDVVLADQAEGRDERAWLLSRSARVLRRGLAELATPSGVWRDEHGRGPGEDAALFRGILAAAVAQLVLARPDADLVAALAVQAQAALRTRDSRGRVRARWSAAGPRGASAPSLAAHLAGTLTLTAAAHTTPG